MLNITSNTIALGALVWSNVSSSQNLTSWCNMTLAVEGDNLTKVEERGHWAYVTNPKKRAFLASFALCGSIVRSSKAAGVSNIMHYEWLKHDEQYRDAYAEAQVMVGDYLESVAIERATLGTEKAVYYQGEIVGYETEHSDSLLKFLLRGAKPQKYSERIDMNVNQKSLQIIIGDLPAAPAPEITFDGAIMALGDSDVTNSETDAEADNGVTGTGRNE